MTQSAKAPTVHGDDGVAGVASSLPGGSGAALVAWRSAPDGTRRGDGFRLNLLGRFELSASGGRVSVPAGIKRMLALLAVRSHGVTRSYLAGTLWADVSEDRAQGSLRSHLSRLRSMGLGLIDKDGDNLELAVGVRVDLYDANRAARAVLDGDGAGADGTEASLLLDPRMTAELLPGWYDEWVLAERERHRQLTLHALELLCAHLAGDCRYADAVLAGLAAINQDPLRESAHRALIRAHLAADNPGEALRCYERYRGLAADAFGLEPSPSTQALVAGMGGGR